MSYASEQAVSNAQWNAALEAQITASEQRRPSVLYRPAVSLDGDHYCALYGPDLMAGCAGFGRTMAEAMADFDRNWGLQATPHLANQKGQDHE